MAVTPAGHPAEAEALQFKIRRDGGPRSARWRKDQPAHAKRQNGGPEYAMPGMKMDTSSPTADSDAVNAMTDRARRFPA